MIIYFQSRSSRGTHRKCSVDYCGTGRKETKMCLLGVSIRVSNPFFIFLRGTLLFIYTEFNYFLKYDYDNCTGKSLPTNIFHL
jgi:hypothetical protein